MHTSLFSQRERFSAHRLRLLSSMTLMLLIMGCSESSKPIAVHKRQKPTPEILEKRCKEMFGTPRVEEVASGVFVAIGYDLANVIWIQTADGHVVIDTGMSKPRATEIRTALEQKSKGTVKAVIYTHSHLDHVGGTSVFADEGAEIWATENFTKHFFKQYGVYRPRDAAGAARQFGQHVSLDLLECSSLGKRTDIDLALDTGMRMPTHTFTKFKAFEVGGVQIELFEAHGETHDQLFVWLPQKKVLMPADNYYSAFPNLYTIRGAKPRDVTQWINSLDQMRRLRPEVLVPSHTLPVIGADNVQNALRDYRDGIQWVRDSVIRGVNMDMTPDDLVRTIGLPPHLVKNENLQEIYGQLDWSIRGIYSNNLGWFSGRTERMYPLLNFEKEQREIKLMGGVDAVWAKAKEAMAAGDYSWAGSLIGKLRDSELVPDDRQAELRKDEAAVYRSLAEGIANTNGRAWLFQVAHEIDNGKPKFRQPKLDEDFMRAMPISLIFDVLPTRLIPEKTIDLHQSLAFEFTDTNEKITVTIRRGVAEVVYGERLPGTPDPVATLRTTTMLWKKLSSEQINTVQALTSGDFKVEGDALAIQTFFSNFRRGF